ncbi:DinB family protein [Paenibacillus hamazuiensis]|uniref:DinB family protein n=1 Tax=Paenibacillus hamazuiensis TaxID=2936508 RepID=UPI00200BFACE|nr:DinB family protein [Paenibacillus hamazuiensis]
MEQLIANYSKGYDMLSEALVGVSQELLNFKPAPDKWSIKEIVIHVSDAEMVAIYRMKKVIAEENPLLFKFDPDAWAGRLHYLALDHEPYLQMFRSQRAMMTQILLALKPENWERTGVHNVAGKQTLRDIVQTFVGHVDRHIKQIERNKEAFSRRSQ